MSSVCPIVAPTKAVDVIDVAPVTTPASMIMVLSRTICCPAFGVIFKSIPAVEEMVLPFTFILSTCKAVNVPKDVIAVCAAPVTVAAVPEALPVTLPVTVPAKFVAVNIPEEGLYVKPVSVSNPCSPVAVSIKVGYTVSLSVLFAVIVTVVALLTPPIYVDKSVKATCFIVPSSFTTTRSASTSTVPLAAVFPSIIFNSVAVAVTSSPSITNVVTLISPAIDTISSASVIKSVSSVCPIVAPLILILSTVSAVNVP